MALRNPVSKGSTQLVAISTGTLSGHLYKITYKIDHPLVGDPQHDLQVTTKRQFPDDLVDFLLGLDDTIFIWMDDQGIEYSLECQHLEGCRRSYMALFNRIEQTIKAFKETNNVG